MNFQNYNVFSLKFLLTGPILKEWEKSSNRIPDPSEVWWMHNNLLACLLCFPAREGRAPPPHFDFPDTSKNWYQSKSDFLEVSGNADTKAPRMFDFLIKKCAALWYLHLADIQDCPKVALNLHVLPVAKNTRFFQNF